MNRFELITLTPKYKQQYLKMIKENADDLKRTGFYYRFPLSNEDTFEEDVNLLMNRSKGIGCNVPNSTFFLMNEDSNMIVGAVNIRHELDDYHFHRGGHIGYYVCQSERNKGYARIMLGKALEFCRKLGMDKVLLTCLKNNIPSAKTIISNGGVFEAENNESGEILQRYWVNL